MTHNINDIVEFTVNARLLFVHKQCMGLSHVVTNVLRKPILSGTLESNIGKVQDMSELATEHKVYCYKILNMYRYKYYALKLLL